MCQNTKFTRTGALPNAVHFRKMKMEALQVLQPRISGAELLSPVRQRGVDCHNRYKPQRGDIDFRLLF